MELAPSERDDGAEDEQGSQCGWAGCRVARLAIEERRSKPHRACASERRAGSLEAGLMSQSAVVRDYRALEIGRRRANRLVLTVAG